MLVAIRLDRLGGVIPGVMVAAIGQQPLDEIVGRYLIYGSPSAERIIEMIVGQFAAAEAAA